MNTEPEISAEARAKAEDILDLVRFSERGVGLELLAGALDQFRLRGHSAGLDHAIALFNIEAEQVRP